MEHLIKNRIYHSFAMNSVKSKNHIELAYPVFYVGQVTEST